MRLITRQPAPIFTIIITTLLHSSSLPNSIESCLAYLTFSASNSNMRLITPTLLYFSLSLVTLTTYLQAYAPDDHFTINCGSSHYSFYPDDNGRTWEGDTYSSEFYSHYSLTGDSDNASVNTLGPTINRIPFATARLFRSQFKYTFFVSTAGPKFLRLFFYPASYHGGFNRGDASFTVVSNGFTLLKDFNPSLTADAEGLDTIFREYTIHVNDRENLELTLTPARSSYAFINGIEVISMPSDLYYTPSTDPGFKLMGYGDNTLYSVPTSAALETSYRIKVGQTILPKNDTGLFRNDNNTGSVTVYDDTGLFRNYNDTSLFRNWEGNDKFYLRTPSALHVVRADRTGRAMNITVSPDYAAPEELYRTARYMGAHETHNKMMNLTWEFPVDAGFLYMLRLHFCELDPNITHTGDRVFFIYVAGKVAEDRADVMKWASYQKGVAVHKNYAVQLTPKNDVNQKKMNLSLQMNSDPFLNGLEIFKISDVASNNLAGPNPDPLQTPPSPQVPGEPNRTHHKSAVIISTVCVTSGVAVLIITMFYFRRRMCKEGSKAHQEFETFLRNHGPLAIRRYSYSDIKKMTNSFAEKLGQGAYGSVFRGKIHEECLVAVKVLNSSKGNGGEFINEVASISRTSHVNIVTLLGFCFEGSKRALVYEFMSNGSLEKFIYGKNPTAVENQLNCETLYQITIGVARGLEYLHKGCNTRIFHFDIKPHNILLDEKFCPKISDFGLAKICHGNQSLVSMLEARGTPGFIAPEVFSRNFGVVSHKSDVYSFGMMVLEMVGGRKNINAEVECYNEIYFPYWIYKRLERDQELALQCIKNAIDSEIAKKMILVSLWCIQTDPSDRPAMSQVVDMLEGSLESLQIPPKPFSSSPRTSPTHYSTSNIESVSVSVNQ